MLYLDINGRPLLLPAGTTAQVEHISPLFADGVEDSYSLPVELPVQDNEEVLQHVAELPLTQRPLRFEKASLGHKGMPLFPGVLHILGSNSRSIRTTFSVDGFVSKLKGVKLPDTMRQEVIDLLEDTMVFGNNYRLRPRFRNGGACQFPMHLNTALYGDANQDWYPSSVSDHNPGSSYSVNDLVRFKTYEPIIRTAIYQCTEDAAPGETPTSHPEKWRKAAFGIVNAWDVENNDIYSNSTDGNFYAMVPWFYLKWTLQKALAHFGYTPVGSFMDDTRTDELLLPNTTTIDQNNAVDDQYFFRATQTAPVFYNPANGWQQFRLPAQDETTPPNQDSEGLWNNSTFRFTCPAPGVWRFRVRTELNVRRPGITRPRIFVRVLDATGAVRGTTTVFLSRLSNLVQTFVNVEFTTDDVGQQFHVVVVQQQPNAAAPTWPQQATDHYLNSQLTVWLLQAEPSVALNDQFIYPHRHMPQRDVMEFILAIGDALNLAVEPDDATRTVAFNYKERSLPGMAQHSTLNASHRQVNEIELDHQRSTRGIRLRWDIETTADELPPPENITYYNSELEVAPPLSTGAIAIIRSTRKVLKGVFRNGDFYWEQVGYHVPPVTVGVEEEAIEIVPAFKPLHMDQVTLDGRSFIIPVLEAPGTSDWFHTQGDRQTLWLCEFVYATDGAPGVVLVSGARSWGWAWGPLGTVEGDSLGRLTLLWDEPDPTLPGLYQSHWKRWLHMLTTAEPVTMDLLVDLPYLTGRQWRHVHHIHGQDYLVEKLPVQYGEATSQMVSRGAYLMRIKSTSIEADGPQEPSFTCPVVDGAFSFTVPSEVTEEDGLYITGFTTSEPQRLLCVIEPDGERVIINNLEGGYQRYGGEVKLGQYCCFPCDEDGEPIPAALDQFILGSLAGTIQVIADPDLSRLKDATYIGINGCLFSSALNLEGYHSLTFLGFGQCTFPTTPTLSDMASLEGLFLSECQLSELPDLSALPALKTFSSQNTPFTAVDNAFIQIEANGHSNGFVIVDGTGAAPVTTASLAARTALLARGYTLQFNT